MITPQFSMIFTFFFSLGFCLSHIVAVIGCLRQIRELVLAMSCDHIFRSIFWRPLFDHFDTTRRDHILLPLRNHTTRPHFATT